MSAADQARPATARVRLARIAERVVDAARGVAATSGAGRRVTFDGTRPIPGVTVAEAPGGRVDMGLHLVVATPTEPLERTADGLRAAIAGEAALEGLAERLGAIDVAFEDVAPPDGGAGPPDGSAAPVAGSEGRR